jgi:hypothetical protein
MGFSNFPPSGHAKRRHNSFFPRISRGLLSQAESRLIATGHSQRQVSVSSLEEKKTRSLPDNHLVSSETRTTAREHVDVANLVYNSLVSTPP